METDCVISPDISLFELQEHTPFEEQHKSYIQSLQLPFVETEYEGVPFCLGITNFTASYYIGASWLVNKNKKVDINNDKAVVVTPKMSDIDFVEMFLSALQFSPSADYFSKFYDIDFESPLIKCDSLNNQLTPLLVIHYLSILQRLVGKGLKKGYVFKEENLHCKVKGKILVSQNLKKNIFTKREDRVCCRYQEFTADIPENRLLKKSLLFADKIIQQLSAFTRHKKSKEIRNKINSLLTHFENVSDDIEIFQIKNVAANKLYKDYNEAIRIAKMILRRFDYSIKKAGEEQHEIPPFWIDMSRLYEVFVYSLLEKAYPSQIKFQVKGHCETAVDFLKLDEQLIMDAKYKPRYENENCNAEIADIREISGYARDKQILEKLKFDEDKVPSCVIIYPVEQKDQNDSDVCTIVDGHKELLKQVSEINGFTKFYKVGVPLPTT